MPSNLPCRRHGGRRSWTGSARRNRESATPRRARHHAFAFTHEVQERHRRTGSRVSRRIREFRPAEGARERTAQRTCPARGNHLEGLWRLSNCYGHFRLVQSDSPHHRARDVKLASVQAHHRRVIQLAFGSLAVVIRLRQRVMARSDPCVPEQCALRPLDP